MRARSLPDLAAVFLCRPFPLDHTPKKLSHLSPGHVEFLDRAFEFRSEMDFPPDRCQTVPPNRCQTVPGDLDCIHPGCLAQSLRQHLPKMLRFLVGIAADKDHTVRGFLNHRSGLPFRRTNLTTVRSVSSACGAFSFPLGL